MYLHRTSTGISSVVHAWIDESDTPVWDTECEDQDYIERSPEKKALVNHLSKKLSSL